MDAPRRRHELHILPTGDLIGHDNNAGCACGPTAEPVIRPDKSIGWVFTHHPLQRQETAS